MQAFEGKKYMIVGAGLTGLSAARWCVRNGYAFDLCDTRERLANEDAIKQEFTDAQLFLGPLNTKQLVQYEQLIVSPGVALSTPAIAEAIQQGVQVTGDIQLFADHCTKPIVAITGSNGKTTVTTLVGEMLSSAGKKVAVGGNIGTPALDLGDADIYVLELSSFQLETTPNLNAEVAVILNISADHMDRYPSLEAYIQAKQNVFNGSKKAIENGHDKATQAHTNNAVGAFVSNQPALNEFGVIQHNGKSWLAHGKQPLIAIEEMKIKGVHNTLNAVAALAIVDALNIDISSTFGTLKEFAGLPHRCQWLGSKDGIAFYNDSKGTNVGATLAAVEGIGAEIDGKIWLLLGGVGKGQDFSSLQAACAQYVAEAHVFGEARKEIIAGVGSGCRSVEHTTLDSALAASLSKAQDGDVVLFSPACASFDQFKNYEQRGEYFTSLVEAVL